MNIATARAAAVAADQRHVLIATIKLLCSCDTGICDDPPNPIGPRVYLCPRCRRFFPWCQGAASEDNPEFCDDCWAAAREGATAP